MCLRPGLFLNDTATTEISTLSLHDALPICEHGLVERCLVSSQYTESLARLRPAEPGLRLGWSVPKLQRDPMRSPLDRKSTRLNSSHANISYAVFCLKKKTDETDPDARDDAH